MEEARAGRTRGGGPPQSGQFGHCDRSSLTVLRELAAECEDLILSPGRLHRIVVQAGEKRSGLGSRHFQGPIQLRTPFAGIAHGRMLRVPAVLLHSGGPMVFNWFVN
jgi:hypothetical protein